MQKKKLFYMYAMIANPGVVFKNSMSFFDILR